MATFEKQNSSQSTACFTNLRSSEKYTKEGGTYVKLVVTGNNLSVGGTQHLRLYTSELQRELVDLRPQRLPVSLQEHNSVKQTVFQEA